MLCRRTPTRKTGHARISKTLWKDWQNARAVLAESPGQRRANRTKDYRYVSGAKQDVFRVARDDQQERPRHSWRLRHSVPRRIICFGSNNGGASAADRQRLIAIALDHSSTLKLKPGSQWFS